jgi:hypothetical protein
VYPHPVEKVELVETHISWVLLAGERVYKIKRPVDLGFLDFTTLSRRRHFCEEEVRLNRRLAPDTYLGVVELKGTPPRVRFGGAGRTLEVAVVMRRLPAERMLDRLVWEKVADPALMDAIGVAVARFHAEAQTGGEVDRFGGRETIRENWEENFRQTAGVPPDVLPPEWLDTLRGYVQTFLAREAERMDARVRAHRIRDCHGDLQAQHVCCTEPIRIFDCIEFNRRFRFGDAASEIAFLAMDLERLGRPDLAIRFLNAYLEASGDYEAVPLLDFYRAYRACVRGKVLSFQVADRPAVAGPARELFGLAVRYAHPRRTPRLLVTTGVMGSGKSTFARAAASRLEAIVIRTDAVRKRLAGLPLHQRADHGLDEGLYSPDMGRRTYAEALRLAGEMLAAGWPVLIDGSFSRADERAEARHLAARRGLPFTVVWCDAPDAVIAPRLRRRATERHEVSDGREELLPFHRARYEDPTGEAGVVQVDTTRDSAAALDVALAALDGPQGSLAAGAVDPD